MFGKRSNKNELEMPPIALSNPEAAEVLRVWAASGNPQQITLCTSWEDPGAWGLMLVDVALHAAKAYANEGHDPKVVLARIRELFDEEWDSPTGEVQDITER